MSCSQVDPASQASRPSALQAPLRNPSRWLPLVRVGLGLAALVVAVAGCSQPAPSTQAAKPTFSDQQVAEAKKAVCDDYEKGFRAIQVAASKSPETSDETFSSTTLNARIAEIGVANYLFNSLNANPAAPAELRDLVDRLAALYQKIAIMQLSDATREEIAPTADKAQELTPGISRICQ
jgi:hypothetical protein